MKGKISTGQFKSSYGLNRESHAYWNFLLNLCVTSVSGPISKKKLRPTRRGWLPSFEAYVKRSEPWGALQQWCTTGSCSYLLAPKYKIMPPLGLRAQAMLWGSQANIRRTNTETASAEPRALVHWMTTQPGNMGPTWSWSAVFQSWQDILFSLCSSLTLLSCLVQLDIAGYVKLSQASLYLIVKLKDLNNPWMKDIYHKTLKFSIHKLCFSSQKLQLYKLILILLHYIQISIAIIYPHLNSHSGIKF